MKSLSLLKIRTHYYKIFLVFIIFLPFLVISINGKVIYWGTASLQFIPWTQFLYDSILEGSFPLWNPYNGFGVPFIANHQSAAFYPLNWLLFPIYLISGINGLAVGMTLMIPLHLSIGGIGITKILQKFNLSTFSQFVGAIIFAFSGYALTRLSFISMIWTYAWLPWIIYASMQLKGINQKGGLRRIVILGLLIGVQLLAGHAQTSFYSILLGLLFVLIYRFRTLTSQLRKLIAYGIAILISFFIAAIQVLPTYELLQNSQRSSEVGYELAVSTSLWPGRLITILFGNFWGNPNYNRFLSGGSFWEENLYLGVIPVLLFGILIWFLVRKNRSYSLSKEFKIFVICSVGIIIFSLLFALGRFFPLFPFLYKFIPTFDLFQAPSRFLLVYIFLLNLLSAVGFDLWNKSRFNHKKTMFFLVVFGGLLIFTLLINHFYQNFPDISFVSLLLGSATGLIFGILTLLRDASWVKPGLARTIILIIIVGDLLLHNFSWNNFQKLNVYQEINNLSQYDPSGKVLLKPNAENFLKFNLFYRPDRLQPLTDFLNHNPELITNTNLLNNRFMMINNFDPLQLNTFSDFWGWFFQLDKSDFEAIASLVGVHTIYDLDPNESTYLIKNEISSKSFIQWYGCTIEKDSDSGFNQILFLEKADPKNRCLIVDNENFQIEMSNADESLNSIIDYEIFNPNRIKIDFEAVESGWIVIRQSWFPGWKAVLDKEVQTEIDVVDYLFQGVQVPAGSHTLELTYFPNSLKAGIILSFLSIGFAIFYLYYSSNRNI